MKKKTIIIEAIVMALMGAGLAVCGNIESEDNEAIVKEEPAPQQEETKPQEEAIIDCNYTLDEALEGCNAPQELKDQLSLYSVMYISTDGKLHQGQILSNKEIEQDVKEMFEIMRNEGFVIEKVIPIVKYDWSDDKSMADNNTYSFCYRDMSYSFHALGMAIDINPYFNPQRWKGEWRKVRRDKPEGAVYDTTKNGTFIAESKIVNEWKNRGFSWGHYMSRKSDDHHFQKGSLNSKPSFSFNKKASVSSESGIEITLENDTQNSSTQSQAKQNTNNNGSQDETAKTKENDVRTALDKPESQMTEKERLRISKERILERTRRHKRSADSLTGKIWNKK